MTDITKAPNINYVWAQLMVEELVRSGVTYFCLAPGSRCSPLTVAIAQNKRAHHVIHYDERGVGFHALGHTAGSGRPTVLVCTSGTAAANFLPAVIEASKKKLPLIVLTADRPPELRLTGAHQTIEQTNLYQKYVRWAVDFPCPTKDIKPEFVLTSVDQAVYRAKGSPRGPVHINCMFREPLAPKKTQANFSAYLANLKQWGGSSKAFTTYAAPKREINDVQKNEMLERLRAGSKGIVVVGKLASAAEQKSVIKLAQKLNWPVFPDISSGLRLGTAHNNVIHYFDQILLSEKIQDKIKPDCILHLGGRITSKRWYEFMERAQPSEHIMVNNHPLRNDPQHNVTYRIESGIGEFCDWVARLNLPSSPNNDVKTLKKMSEKTDVLIDDYLNKIKPLNEIFTARAVSDSISPRDALFLASSMPIRDFDMYASASKNSVTIGSNRGASGIDGTIASAAGYSIGQNKAVTLMIGDLACLHDLNSLSMLRNLPKPMTVVVLNNNGGGIFSFLPIEDYKEVFESFFGTPHNLTFESAAEFFGLDYTCPSSKNELIDLLKSTPKASRVIEIKTLRSENHDLHVNLQGYIRGALNRVSSVNKQPSYAKLGV